MGFEASRPVPWRQLIIWSALVIGLTNLSILLLSRKEFGPSIVVSSVIGGASYLAIGALLSKFGWQPPSAKRNREQAEARRAAAAAKKSGSVPAGSTAVKPKAKPAPTSRTSTGPNRPQTQPKRKR